MPNTPLARAQPKGTFGGHSHDQTVKSLRRPGGLCSAGGCPLPRAGQVTSIKGCGSFWSLNSRGGPQGQLLPKGQIQGLGGPREDPERTLQWLHERGRLSVEEDAGRTGLPQAPRGLQTVSVHWLQLSKGLSAGLWEKVACGRREAPGDLGKSARQRELPTPAPSPSQKRSWSSLGTGVRASFHSPPRVSLGPCHHLKLNCLCLASSNREAGSAWANHPGTRSSNTTESRLRLAP